MVRFREILPSSLILLTMGIIIRTTAVLLLKAERIQLTRRMPTRIPRSFLPVKRRTNSASVVARPDLNMAMPMIDRPNIRTAVEFPSSEKISLKLYIPSAQQAIAPIMATVVMGTRSKNINRLVFLEFS